MLVEVVDESYIVRLFNLVFMFVIQYRTSDSDNAQRPIETVDALQEEQHGTPQE